ncbi:PREDICTED: ultraviolet-B receptor UVR8 [Ipomoea nil]|uniref:ultraviolet-B receptor UVR8 n=1 Tax=Ipomoea nil TaxID=35883 RepID=UPI00090105E9|nr:PREDICTED: ultraviolet-B receptor UVR8 [Ipomoea nil]XP_019197135.1 PREDICTED: ultraviolet-B receptor UVR8 [Ipomoea nil]XP_019197136.1 PREDICTED: ultraviolet-B receptor UVR8 [Ipomoea nil]
MENFPQSSAPPLDYRKLSHKITEIAAGEAHTLVLTADGRVYSWGRGMFGRLGTGSEFDQLFPVRVEFGSAPVKIVAIAAGAYHSLALADDGSVWGWGYNVYGQLGGNGENYLAPHLLDGFLGLGSPNTAREDSERKTLMISSVKAGAMMSVAIDSLGGLWIWGNCPQPQQDKSTEAEFSLTCTFNPVPVWNFHGHTVVKVACGNEHVVALVTIGETYKGNDLVCYSWGGNSHGQLGLGDRESRLFPEIIEPFNSESPWTVYEVACGSFHTALIAQKSPSDMLESVCWTFGLGENGQLGHGTTQSYFSPEPVKELPKTAFLISVDCGLFHTSVVSSAGDVWSWGMERGLGLCPDARFIGTETGDAILPLSIPCNGHYGPKFPEPVQVVCGAAHTVLLADSGYKLWSWGRGRSGVLGTGKITDSFAPTVAMWPPIDEDSNEEVLDNNDKNEKTEEKKPKDIVEMEKKLLDAMGEINQLQSKLSVMERYAGILHSSIFGRPFQEQDIPASLQSGGTFDIAKEWENMLESSDRGKLVRLEMFYRNMLAGVKDNVLKKRIKEIVVDCLGSSR